MCVEALLLVLRQQQPNRRSIGQLESTHLCLDARHDLWVLRQQVKFGTGPPLSALRGARQTELSTEAQNTPGRGV